MANSAYLLYSGGTVQLQDASNGLDFTYTPMSTSLSDEFVTETGRLRVSKSSITDVRTAVQNVARAIDEAQRYNNYGGGTAPVYLYFQPEGYSDAYRTEVVNGYIAPQDSNMDNYRWSATGVKYIEFDVEMQRRNWFEGPETALTVSNPNGTATTVSIDFYNDGGGTAATAKRYNYIDIAGTAVIGDLIAPVIITVTDTAGSANFQGLKELNIHVGWDGDITATSRYEAEAGYLTSAAGTAQALSGASGGTGVWNAMYNQHQLLDYEKYAGNQYEIYARVINVGVSAGTAEMYARLGAVYFDYPLEWFEKTAPIQQTVEGNGGIFSIADLGPLYLPSVYVPGIPYSDLYLTVKTDVDLRFDVIHVLPLNKRITANVLYSAWKIVIDTVTDKHYARGGGFDSGTGDNFTQPVSTNGDIGLHPGKNQRLHFIDPYTFGAFPTKQSAVYTVSVSYRPRRLTV